MSEENESPEIGPAVLSQSEFSRQFAEYDSVELQSAFLRRRDVQMLAHLHSAAFVGFTEQLLGKIAPNTSDWAWILLLHGIACMHLTRLTEAQSSLQIVVDFAEETDNQELQFEAKLHFAVNLVTGRDIDMGLSQLEKLRDETVDNDHERQFVVQCHLSRPYIYKGFFATALISARHALELSGPSSPAYLMQQLYMSLAIIHTNLGNNAATEHFYELAAQQAQIINIPASIGKTLINLVQHRITISEIDVSTLEMLKEADELMHSDSSSPRRISVVMCYALLFIKRGEYEAAEPHALQALQMSEELNVSLISHNTNRYMAMIELARGNNDEALRYAKHSLEFARLDNHPAGTKQGLNILAKVHKQMGNLADALKCTEEILDIFNVQFGENHKKLHIELQSSLAVSSARQQAEQARTETERQKLALAQTELKHQKIKHELVAKALQLSETANLMQTLDETVRKARNAGPKTAKKLLFDLSREIRNHINDENIRESFEQEFAVLYPKFIDSMARRFPDLTKRELHISALLRLKISNDDISRIMRIARRSIDSYRYRIRKKLGLDRGADLAAFLAEIDQ